MVLPVKHSTKLPSEFKKIHSTATSYYCTTDVVSQLNARALGIEDKIIKLSAEACKFNILCFTMYLFLLIPLNM